MKKLQKFSCLPNQNLDQVRNPDYRYATAKNRKKRQDKLKKWSSKLRGKSVAYGRMHVGTLLAKKPSWHILQCIKAHIHSPPHKKSVFAVYKGEL